MQENNLMRRLSPVCTVTKITEVCEGQWTFDYGFPVTVCFEQASFLWKDVARITGQTISVETSELVHFQKGYEGVLSCIVFTNNQQWAVREDFAKLNRLFLEWNSQLSSVFTGL